MGLVGSARIRTYRVALAASAMAAVTPALAQDSGDAAPPVAATPAAVEGAQSYTPEDFARFSPKTALDMLRQVPGFTIEEQDERRGLGQATANVLVNGQRFSGKSNDVVTELSRISASNVTRIDIVDGATLAVPGLSGQVANIITSSTGMSGSFAWRPQIRARRTEARLTNGEASISGQAAGFDYTLSIQNNSFRNGNAGPEIVYTPDRTIIDRREEVLTVYGEEPRLSGSLKRILGDGSILNVNAAAGIFDQDVQELGTRIGPDQPDRFRDVTEITDRYNYELGGDYEFGLGAGRLKLIGLHRFEHNEFTQTLVQTFADDTPTLGQRFTQIGDEAETIARAEYRWKAGPADWQASVEGALNSLEVENGLQEIDDEGEFVPIPFPNSTGTVEEKRAEATLTYGRPLSPELTLQASLGGEYSRLTQSGPNGLDRTFYRPKGFVSLAWRPTAGLDISARLEREVGQLNFFDFVASANVSGGTANGGNANLVPPQSWNLDLEATRNLGIWGTTTLRLYGEQITDIVDIVPIGEDGQAPGNLDSALLYGVQWTSTVNLDPLGWRGAKVDLDLQFQRTRLDDPVTGVRRAVNEDVYRRVVVNFRHDVPATDWAYGWGLDHFAQTPGYRLDQRFRFANSPGNVGIFVEHKDVLGMTVRGSVDNLLGTEEGFDRSFYDRRRTNDLLFTESRDRFYGPVFTLAISGKI